MTTKTLTRLCRCCNRKFKTKDPRHTMCEKCAWDQFGDTGIKQGTGKEQEK